jgi:hypothetical protein
MYLVASVAKQGRLGIRNGVFAAALPVRVVYLEYAHRSQLRRSRVLAEKGGTAGMLLILWGANASGAVSAHICPAARSG